MVKPVDTEEKEPWYDFGEKAENEFLRDIAPRIGLSIIKNPEKSTDLSAIDYTMGIRFVDLKKQETPFFKAGLLYGIDPQFCVTFNLGDYWTYTHRYDPNNVDLIFWVQWSVFKKFGISVKPMNGVWIVDMNTICQWVEKKRLPIVNYQRRIYDQKGNSKSSYLLNLKEMKELAIFL